VRQAPCAPQVLLYPVPGLQRHSCMLMEPAGEYMPGGHLQHSVQQHRFGAEGLVQKHFIPLLWPLRHKKDQTVGCMLLDLDNQNKAAAHVTYHSMPYTAKLRYLCAVCEDLSPERLVCLLQRGNSSNMLYSSSRCTAGLHQHSTSMSRLTRRPSV
jgi:hypothetical protein